jgi:threonylcarbamoyladenosine tRNA methylthiotransferase MtaB
VLEAEKLSKQSKEIVVVGIDLSSYKIDGRLALGELLYKLKDLPCRIRIGSLEVNVITEEFLNIISSIPNLCPHFHLSMQSGCDTILQKMNRHYSVNEYLEKCELLRKYFPNCNITTDIIVGFSDESIDEFNETIETVKKAKFGNIHIFPYSPRKGTVAYNFKNITNDIRHERVDVLEEYKETYRLEYINSLCGTYTMLVEEEVDNFYTGYLENYVKVYVEKSSNINLNEFYDVKIICPYRDGALVEVI